MTKLPYAAKERVKTTCSMMISSKILIHRGRGIPSILSTRRLRTRQGEHLVDNHILINHGRPLDRGLILFNNRGNETWEI